MSNWKTFTKGLIKENPILVLLLGCCPTLATTTSAINGMSMGLATTFVLIMSNLVISLLKNFIPDKVRIPCFIVVIASFVTVVQLIMQAYHEFTDGELKQTVTDGTEIRVESKVRENDYFKYSKIFIKAPEKDTEIIPWLTDKNEYLQKNVAPYSPNFVVDEKKTRIGYEIPFTREFYKYTPLKPSADIFEELKSLEQQESELMEKLLH